jgi:hypothetical protein
MTDVHSERTGYCAPVLSGSGGDPVLTTSLLERTVIRQGLGSGGKRTWSAGLACMGLREELIAPWSRKEPALAR